MLDTPEARPGTYALLLRSPQPCQVQVGRLGALQLRRGWYVYVGSAFGPGGVRARVARHARARTPRHWHIDYLKPRSRLDSVFWTHDPRRLEHLWASAARELPGATAPLPGFGASDCGCSTHLSFHPGRPDLQAVLELQGASVSSTIGTNSPSRIEPRRSSRRVPTST